MANLCLCGRDQLVCASREAGGLGKSELERVESSVEHQKLAYVLGIKTVTA